ncbi:MAG: thiamine pyrophosphate-binding protein, partial [Deltaproteobacteria bacterium]|nr:thiamine pyrophosphate-binding protein [Deltaproteobacteria bacterium]
MAKMTAAEAVVKVLESEGVRHAWGIPGAAINPFYQALGNSKITHYTVRHEEGATHAAEGFTRASGEIGVAIGTSGPAGTNMVTGLYSAIADSIPILTITGQAVRSLLHKEGFQAINIVDIVKPVTKWAVMIQEAAQAPYIVREAFRIMRSGRPGPVHIDLPLDVQREIIEYDPSIDAPLPVVTPEPHAPRIERALDMIAAAKHPLIISGGGVIIDEASAVLIELAEQSGIPVVPTLMGWGSIPDDHPLHVGLVGLQTHHRGANAAFLESDLVIGIGNRWGDRHTGDLAVYRKGRKFIHVDIESTQIGRVFEPDLGIVSSAKSALKALLEGVKARKKARKWTDFSSWAERCRELKSTLLRRSDYENVPIRPQRVFHEINAFFDRD